MSNRRAMHACACAADVKGGGESDDDDDDEPPSRKPAAKKPAKRARKAGSDDEDGGGKRKGTGFNKPLLLSDEFAAACGRLAMSRGEISKWIYSYCDEHNLKVGKLGDGAGGGVVVWAGGCAKVG